MMREDIIVIIITILIIIVNMDKTIEFFNYFKRK